MDLVRSCYTTKMRFFTDNDLGIPVKWFFAEPDAKVFPAHHLFGSGNWASDKFGWNGPGEVLGAPRKWSNGANPGGLVGDHFCGPLTGFTEGTKFPGIPLHADLDGICLCCVNLHLACGPHLDIPRMLHGVVTAADPANTIFVLGFDFWFTWNPLFGAWRAILPETDPALLPWLFVQCSHFGGSNFRYLTGAFSPGAPTTGETITPFSLTWESIGPGLYRVQYPVHTPPPPGGVFDFFNLLVTA